MVVKVGTPVTLTARSDLLTATGPLKVTVSLVVAALDQPAETNPFVKVPLVLATPAAIAAVFAAAAVIPVVKLAKALAT